MQSFAQLCNLNFLSRIAKNAATSANLNQQKMSAVFNEKIEIRERCKGVHCVDLGESFPTNIYLQKSASIQPRRSHLIFIILAASRDLIFTERSSPVRHSACAQTAPHAAQAGPHFGSM